MCFCASEAITLTMASLRTGTATWGRWRDEEEEKGERQKLQWNDLRLQISHFTNLPRLTFIVSVFPWTSQHFSYWFIYFCSRCKRSLPRQTLTLCSAPQYTNRERITFLCFLRDVMQWHILKGNLIERISQDNALFGSFSGRGLELDKQLHSFHVQRGNAEFCAMLQMNENLFFTKFPLISAFPCLFSSTQRTSWYAADGWDTTATRCWHCNLSINGTVIL